MRRLGRWAGRLLLGLLVLALLLLGPVAYVELACRGAPTTQTYQPLLPPGDRRPEARTVMTYPEWHIVYAYEDYAATIRDGDPHEFGFLRAVGQFWRSACAMNRAAAGMGGADWTARRTIHVIGVSFTLEMGMKALYEETVGRLAAWARGPERSPLDDLSAGQAAAYADFLRQTPWYRWDFRSDAEALSAADAGSFRDRERDWALGLEYRAKAAYARAVGAAVAAAGFDALTMRSIVAGLAPEALAEVEGVTVVAARPEGVEIETPRYQAFTAIARALAARGARFVEIAGNDEIMVTAIAPGPEAPEGWGEPLLALRRQGNPGWRQLILLPVGDLAAALAEPALGVEHVQDY